MNKFDSLINFAPEGNFELVDFILGNGIIYEVTKEENSMKRDVPFEAEYGPDFSK